MKIQVKLSLEFQVKLSLEIVFRLVATGAILVCLVRNAEEICRLLLLSMMVLVALGNLGNGSDSQIIAWVG